MGKLPVTLFSILDGYEFVVERLEPQKNQIVLMAHRLGLSDKRFHFFHDFCGLVGSVRHAEFRHKTYTNSNVSRQIAPEESAPL